NTVDPQRIIETYGADTARWFMLSDSPPERDMEWTAKGIEGAYRFLHRLWRQVTEGLALLESHGDSSDATPSDAALRLRRASHKAVAAVTEDLEQFRFNRAVARIHELSNAVTAYLGEVGNGGALGAGDAPVLRESLELLVRLCAPMMPHLAEELWEQLGHAASLLADQPWPEADAALLVEEAVTLGVQVNGKLRAAISLPRDAAEAVARETALAEPAVQRALGDKPPRKVIVVKNRIVNVVV
ncbi:MAG TPA: class I tRNA ligase family protein, partial [Kiloniellales bacterium]|nr:class I tRNA ligase family protein [Kiloniellales bacterium]